jgi:hypothetical protein
MAEGAVQFGISLVPATERLDRTRELVRVADEAGLDLVGIQDHPYQRHFLDTWALIPALLGETERISFVTDVANLPLRPPAVMAKAAASLDVLSGGRFELGLGAGAFGDVVASFGGPRRTPGESVEALDEAIDGRTRSGSGWARSGRGCCVSRAARPTAGCRRSASSTATSCARATSRSTPRPRGRAATLARSAGSSTCRA